MDLKYYRYMLIRYPIVKIERFSVYKTQPLESSDH